MTTSLQLEIPFVNLHVCFFLYEGREGILHQGARARTDRVIIVQKGGGVVVSRHDGDGLGIEDWPKTRGR